MTVSCDCSCIYLLTNSCMCKSTSLYGYFNLESSIWSDRGLYESHTVPMTPGWCKIDLWLGATPKRVPAVSREDSRSQAILQTSETQF